MSDDNRYKIALAGALPGDQANGWDDEDFAQTLDNSRAKTRYARVAYNVMSAKEVTATGKKILTIQLQRIEPIPDNESPEEERALLDLFEQRTGQSTLFPPKTADDE